MYYTDSKRDDSLRGFERYSQLLIPERLVEQIEQDNVAKKAAASVAVEPKPDELEENLQKNEGGLGSAPFLPASRDVEVFAPADVERLKARKMRTGSDYRTRLKETLPLLEKNGGRRLIPDLELDVIEMITGKLRRRFPNFSPVIDHLATELTFAMASTAEAFRLPPLLLYGAPGIGKTAFCQELARLLGVGFAKISAAGTQGAFDLVGSSVHWSEASPGAIFTILADGEYATPVVLIDEIDKMPQDSRFPVIPAFLEFLEPESAKTFTDQSMMLPFDASKVIVVATANEIDDISGPLLSRFVQLEVNSPTMDDRRQIVATVFRESVEGLLFGVDISDDAIDTLARAPIDVRAIKQALRLAIGIAIGRQDGMVGTIKIPFRGKKERRRVGFI